MSRPRMEARLGRFEPASPDLRRIQEISRQLMSRGRLETMRGRYQGSLARLGEALGNHERAAERVGEASRQLDAALGGVYRDPVAARQRIEATLERHGAGETVRALSERPASAGKLHGHVASRARGQAREALRERVPEAIRSYASARQAERAALQRLERFRRNPKQPVLAAAGRARAVLGRALKRLESLDRRREPLGGLPGSSATRLWRRRPADRTRGDESRSSPAPPRNRSNALERGSPGFGSGKRRP